MSRRASLLPWTSLKLSKRITKNQGRAKEPRNWKMSQHLGFQNSGFCRDEQPAFSRNPPGVASLWPQRLAQPTGILLRPLTSLVHKQRHLNARYQRERAPQRSRAFAEETGHASLFHRHPDPVLHLLCMDGPFRARGPWSEHLL